MRKIFLLLLFVTAIGTLSKAVDKVIANYDGISPKSDTVLAPLVLTRNAANPSIGGINTSAQVAHVFKPAHVETVLNKAYEISFDSMKLELYPLLSVKLFGDTTAVIQPALIDSKGAETLIPFTDGMGVKTGQSGAWVQVTYDLSKYLKVLRYQGIKFYIQKADSAKAINIYFDDIVLSSLANSDSIVVAAETFGDADLRADGSLPIPKGYPNPTWTTAHASINTITLPIHDSINGNDTWYFQTVYDSLAKIAPTKIGFTVENGKWEGRHSLWHGTNIHQNLPASGYYPNRTNPPASASLLMASTGKTNVGWDSIRLQNIDIKGVTDFNINFGLSERDQYNDGRRNKIFIWYSIDGGAYTILDTALYQNFPPLTDNRDMWRYLITPTITGVTGSKMDVLVQMFTSNDNARYMLDDFTVSGKYIPVTDLTIDGAAGKTSVSVGVPLQMEVTSVLPADAYDQSVTWSVADGTGTATIDPASGILTGLTEGDVTVTATANDNSGVTTNAVITIAAKISSIKVFTAGGVNTISTVAGTLQMYTEVLPITATDSAVIWSVVSAGGNATIDVDGLLTATVDGDVFAKAIGKYDASVKDSMMITISGQPNIDSVFIIADTNVIDIDNGTLMLIGKVNPNTIPDTTVSWALLGDVSPDTATLETKGDTAIITAVRNGMIIARATSNLNPLFSKDIEITISNQVVPVVSVSVTSSGSTITTDKGTLQMGVTISPADATNQNVTWSISNTAIGAISATGLLSAIKNGSEIVTATSVDGSHVGTKTITFSNQITQVTGITIANLVAGPLAISTYQGTLHLKVNVLPADASVKTVTWDMFPASTLASVSASGVVTATGTGNGDIIVRAISTLTPSVSDTALIHLTNNINSLQLLEKYNIAIGNPVVNGQMIIKNASSISMLKMYNLNGELVKMIANNIQSKVDVSDLASGLYITNVTVGKDEFKVLIVIK